VEGGGWRVEGGGWRVEGEEWKGAHHEDDLRNLVFVLPTTRERIKV